MLGLCYIVIKQPFDNDELVEWSLLLSKIKHPEKNFDIRHEGF